MARKTPDVELHADDILYIPENRKSELSIRYDRQILTVGGGAAAYALVVYTTGSEFMADEAYLNHWFPRRNVKPERWRPAPKTITIEIPPGLLNRQQPQQEKGQDDRDSSIPLSQYLWLIGRHKWKVIGFVAFAVIATALGLFPAHAYLSIHRDD